VDYPGETVSILIGFAMMVYGAWRAYVNYELFGAARKEFGPEWMWPAGIPKYANRVWLWVGVAVLGAIMCGFFEGGSGCGSRMNPC